MRNRVTPWLNESDIDAVIVSLTKAIEAHRTQRGVCHICGRPVEDQQEMLIDGRRVHRVCVGYRSAAGA